MPNSSSHKSHSSNSSHKSHFVSIGEVNKKSNMPIDSPKITTRKMQGLIEKLRSGHKVFLFTFMVGCVHCDNAKPEWGKLSVIEKDGVTIAMLNQELLDENGIKNMLQLDESNEEKKKEKEDAVKMLKELLELTGPAPTGFPNFKVISLNGKKVEEYDGNRDVESFKKWIESHSRESHSRESHSRESMREKVEKGKFVQKGWQMGGQSLRGGRSRTRKGGKKFGSTFSKGRKGRKGGKWSRKYKKSINCKRPKGFSQKQYCKYGRKSTFKKS